MSIPSYNSGVQWLCGSDAGSVDTSVPFIRYYTKYTGRCCRWEAG
ncbi:hypothetical protein F442_02903, partial [Phytophthora nicotianae P10297]